MEKVLTAAGATLHDIVKWTVFMVHGQEFTPGLRVFQQHWGTKHAPPAISSAMVASLAHPNFLVEIEARAMTRG